MTKKKPDLTSVRTLITSVSPLARHLKLTNAAIYRWIKVNRVPGEHMMKVANFYDVELRDLLPMTGSDLSAPPLISIKPRTVLPTLMEVKAGTLTLKEAAARTGQTEISLQLVLTHWGEQLGLLHGTLEALDKGEIGLDEASERLGVAKYTVHGLRRRYGYAPGHVKRKRPEPTIKKRKENVRQAALAVIAGNRARTEVMVAFGVSASGLVRAMEEMGSLNLKELAAFPFTFRLAYAKELETGMPKYVEAWLRFAHEHDLFVRKVTKYPDTPKDWRAVPLRRLLIGVLLGEGSVKELAAARGAEPVILESLFASELKAFGLAWNEVKNMPIEHQTALAELLIWYSDRKRKFRRSE